MCKLVVDDTVDGKDNRMEETMEVGDIMITSDRIIGLLLLLTGVLLPLLHLEKGIHFIPLHLDDVMNHSVVTHIEAAKHLNVPTISTADHSAALVEEHSIRK